MTTNITMKINPLHLTSVNHVSLLCRSVEASISFYHNVLGFVPVMRPGSFDFDGAWLFGYGIGIHLLQSEEPEKMARKGEINPKDNHISFQCESMGEVEKKLKEMGIECVRAIVEEGGVKVEQLFFHDPDGFMIEICDCDNLPVVPIVGGGGGGGGDLSWSSSCSCLNMQALSQQQHQAQPVVKQH